MALLNRRLKEKAPEDLPLLEEPEKVVVDLDEEEEDEKDEVFVHHGITLWVSDAVILTIEQLQIFALLLAMSERWGFPLTFIKASYYVFLVNLDIWEFIKVYSGAYSGFTNTYVASSTIPISYGYYLIAWTVFIALICFGFLGMYCLLLRKRPLYLLLHVARMKRVFCVLAQLMCLPVAIVFARTFHCRYNEKNQLVWNVANEVQCWTMPHYIYVAIAVLIAFLLFLCYPINMIRKIRGQVISYDQGKHEGYLQLKEAEYNQGLDILWAVGQFHLFSSFRRMWVYYRPIIFCLKLALICFFGLLIHFESIFTRSLAERLMVTFPIVAAFFIIVFISVSSSVSKPPITAFRSFVSWFLRKVLMEMFHIFFSVRLNMLALKPVVVMLAFGVYNCQQAGGALGSMFCLLALVMIRTFPFRVASFNIMVIMSLLFNAGNSYIGFLLEQFKHNMVQSSLLAEPYPTYALLLNSAWWLSFLFFWWMYLLLRYYQVVGRGRPLWPMLSTDGKGNMGEETKKYMRAVLHGRHILERALTSPPIFAPVHELERQIHIINAYCREAEYVEDPTFESLWDLLDELIEAHKALAPSSLFSQSVKKTIRETAKEFLKMMPAMRRRLDRRDYDFILMTPLKRRILLKMYVLGTFVNGRSSRLCQEIENKVHMDLEKAAQKSSSSDLADSSLSFMDSSADNKDMYATTDTIGTMSSTGSSFLPGRDSVDQLLYEVGTLEDELQLQEPSTSSDGSDRGKRKKMSVTSLPSIDERELARPGMYLAEKFHFNCRLQCLQCCIAVLRQATTPRSLS